MIRTWYIYALIDPRTDEVRYVGWTFRVEKRLIEHISKARRGAPAYVSRWIRQLLSLDLKPLIRVVEASTGDWQEAERRWIAYYRAAGVRLTNLSDGGEGTPGVPMSESAKRKLSEARRGVPYQPGRVGGMQGKTHSPEVRAKIAAAARGKRHTAETRQRLSEKKRGAPLPESAIAASLQKRKGVPLSDEHRRKIAATTTNRKPVRNKDTGDVYPSITAAAQAMGVNEATIYQSIHKGRRGAGYYWELVHE